MKRTMWILLLVIPLAIAFAVRAQTEAPAAADDKLQAQVNGLQNEVAALIKEEKFAQAADKLEELQVLFMNSHRYQDALDASMRIEEVSRKASERRSPWNYVRIAEAYLGMGERETYFEWMEKAVHERNFSKLTYFQDAHLDAIRDDPRFKSIVAACEKEIGLGQKARDFQIALLDGSTFALSEQKGKVVLIDFWDVGCIPCRREMPNLKKIFKDFGDKDLEMLGISLDTDRTLLEKYVKKEKLPWKIGCSFNGWTDSTAQLYRVSATPTTWLIDRHGIVRYYDLNGEQLRRAVEELTRE